MRVGIYAGSSHPVAAALLAGFAAAGCATAARASTYYCGEVEPFDLVVSYGMRSGRRVRDAYRAAGIPVLVVDWGYLSRVNCREEHRVGHFQVGLGELNAIPTIACPSDRFDALGLEIVERGGDPNGYVLVCGQVPGDAAHGMGAAGYRRWLRQVIGQYPDAVYRPHPRGGIDLPGVEPHKGSLAEALAGAKLVVTWNSNVGHEALLAGIPVVAHGPAAYAELCGEELPSLADRLAYFHRVAYGQWTLAEMETGAPQRFWLDHLLPGLPLVDEARPDDAAPQVQIVDTGPDAQPADAIDLPADHGLSDLKAMKLPELRKLAAERGVKIPAGTNKDGIIELLQGAA